MFPPFQTAQLSFPGPVWERTAPRLRLGAPGSARPLRSSAAVVLVVLLWCSTSACFAQQARDPIDTDFRAQLTALAAKCDDLKLPEAAKKTREWWIDRDPHRQYVFTSSPISANAAPASDLEQKWLAKFTEHRREYAQRLFELARQDLTKGSASNSYRLLHEVLYQDPDHAEAKRILTMTSEDVRPRARQPRVAHSRHGWERGKWWQIDSPHFQVATDAGQQAGVELALQLEDFHTMWQQVFFDYWSSRTWLANRIAGKTSPAPPERKHQVVLFRDREEYLRQLTPAEPKISLTLGYYRKINQTSYFYAGDDAALSVWYHEGAHQLFQEIGEPIQSVGEKWNFWVVEGVAVYLESAVKRGGYFTLGGFDADRLQFVRSRTMGGEPPMPIEELSALGRDALQKHPDIRKLYTQAAGLSHYLMDGRDGKDRDDFIRRIADSYAGRDTPRSFTTLPSIASADFERDFREFLCVTDDDLNFLQPNKSRKNLSLAGAKITDESLRKVAGSEGLEWLDLAYTPVTDVGIANLGPLPNLKRLTLVSTKITNAVVPKLLPPALPCLEELDLSGTAITDEALSHLKAAKQLKVLRLSHTGITDAGLAHLTPLQDLEELDLDQTSTTPTARDNLKSQLPKLK